MKHAKMHVIVHKRHPSNRKLQDKTSTRDSKYTGHPAKYMRTMTRKNKNKTRTLGSKLPTFARKASSTKTSSKGKQNQRKEKTPLFPLFS